MTDVIDAVLGGERAAAVRAVRQARPAVVEHTQGVHDALFDGPGGRAFGRARLAAIAADIATRSDAKELAAHYNELAGEAADAAGDPVLAAALAHAALLTTAPATATHAHIDALYAAGLTERGVVTVTQLVGFVHYQIRLLAGLELIGDAHE
ncbi:CMD domain protein [Nocardia colli]|uniref:CMD domain protein n=1 Tax=Nocardia colli TaxID=2545717 RepID=A0A5N0ELB7_9NOCA|nr:CMD domain protein [Nocardia colli]KAA8890042.1 CMD domain protein [Nocardia colli]